LIVFLDKIFFSFQLRIVCNQSRFQFFLKVGLLKRLARYGQPLKAQTTSHCPPARNHRPTYLVSKRPRMLPDGLLVLTWALGWAFPSPFWHKVLSSDVRRFFLIRFFEDDLFLA